MKRLAAPHDTVHAMLWEKDERELYSRNPVDYYALHYRRRIAAIGAMIRRNSAHRLLEIGAAQGNVSICCAEAGAFCVALDINYSFLRYSKMKHEHGALSWVQANGDALPFTDASFDTVVLGEVLEHCAWPEHIVAAAARLCSRNGHIIITTPNNDFWDATEKTFTDVAHDRSAIEQHQFGPDGDDHLFTFTMEELAGVIESSGLSIVRKQYLCSHFFHVKRLYHLRKHCPFLFNTLLEAVVPVIPVLRRRYTSTLLLVAEKR